MDNKLKKTALCLLVLGSLTACNSSDDNSTVTSNDYITAIQAAEEVEEVVESTEEETVEGNESTVTASNLLLNGDFESWTDGVPDGWTTIETGISVLQSVDVYHSESSSAAVSVNTDVQGDTDFRQSIDVTAGATYLFSTWIYHTEGMVSARLYVDGYQGYSDADLVNQWQEVTYSYTADEDKSIEVGLRFYDQTGFDGEEIVYVDNFSFSSDDQTTTDDTVEETVDEVVEDEVVEEPTDEYVADDSDENLLVNGDFESWSASLPSDWTTIDGDITVSQNTSIYNEGTSSAEVSVNSGSQGDTDIRQSIDVIEGTTYTFSTWVYHTEGLIKARLYIGAEYATYSDNTVLNAWQEVTYSYTAAASESIEAGIRFYDQTGYVDPEIVYIDDFSVSSDSSSDTSAYYASAADLTGLELKTALYNIVKDHTTKTYSNLWDFMGTNSLDVYYENDGSILDMYSENPSSSDTYNYTPVTDQCGNYSGEGSCYNREHSFPKSWFDDQYPMYTDIHHLFATDGYVNGKRSNYPYGIVGTSTFVSDNGSKVGSASSDLGYSGTVFEPIDEFKGDFARAYFYMATRYEDIISTWEVNSDSAAAVLDSSSDYVFEEWVITMLKSWNENDPVSQKELDRNEAAYEFQGNRNPFIDHPEYVNEIWAD
ncbi:endonuclease [uncultured Psychromonas sp.]|uniref:endonuclease n=1 Tax=uncultured Psychromonas sp. TaxID=173974 RepID=UPI002609FE66|nr:endonuclease [uncultured Psychromonas sp.]